MIVGSMRDDGGSFVGLDTQLTRAGFAQYIAANFGLTTAQQKELSLLYDPLTLYNDTNCCSRYW
jgi:hypothetical protein